MKFPVMPESIMACEEMSAGPLLRIQGTTRDSPLVAPWQRSVGDLGAPTRRAGSRRVWVLKSHWRCTWVVPWCWVIKQGRRVAPTPSMALRTGLGTGTVPGQLGQLELGGDKAQVGPSRVGACGGTVPEGVTEEFLDEAKLSRTGLGWGARTSGTEA